MPGSRDKTGNKAKKNSTSFKPGQSGNPNGRAKIPEEFKKLANKYSIPALRKVIEIMNNPEASHKDQLRGAEMVMDRALGKALQNMDVEERSDQTITIKLEGEAEEWSK